MEYGENKENNMWREIQIGKFFWIVWTWKKNFMDQSNDENTFFFQFRLYYLLELQFINESWIIATAATSQNFFSWKSWK